MAKVFGLGGNVSGRAGSYVFRVRGGKTIMSQYNPIVSNPDTKGQSDQRAKFKLLTQLSAVLRGAYAFGTISVAKRKTKMTQANAFFRKNYPNVQIVESNGSKAETSLPLLQLTDGTLPLSSSDMSTSSGAEYVSARLTGIFDYVTQVRCVVLRRLSRRLPDDTEEFYYVQTFNEVQNVVNNEVTFETGVPRGAIECTIYMYGYMQTSTNRTDLGEMDASQLDDHDNFLASVQVHESTNTATANTTATIGVSLT